MHALVHAQSDCIIVILLSILVRQFTGFHLGEGGGGGGGGGLQTFSTLCLPSLAITWIEWEWILLNMWTITDKIHWGRCH